MATIFVPAIQALRRIIGSMSGAGTKICTDPEMLQHRNTVMTSATTETASIVTLTSAASRLNMWVATVSRMRAYAITGFNDLIST
ncbi:unnamed protein product [Linum tenue]|uniref:Uncharacterized protein n=1 Tax=Linum tenue TaxID=586396 RepID=A0AAV0N2M8_9ROSI|nr:unnamed protein product [Linum tenue]